MSMNRVLGRALSIEELGLVAGGGEGTSAADDTITCTPAIDNDEEEEEETEEGEIDP